MKKFLSLILSIALVFSLCIPVMAVEDLNPPLYESYGYSSMAEMLDEWEITEEEYWTMVEEEHFYENWKYNKDTGDFDPPIWSYMGYSSKAEMLNDWDMTSEDYRIMVDEYRVSYDWNYDESTGDFDPPLWSYYGYSSRAEMLKDWDITGEEYDAMVEDERLWQEQQSWNDEQWEQYFEEQLKIEKEAMGLVYDINVMFQDKPQTFTDAVPEITNDRVMVPLRAVMENMGADVQYDDANRTATIISGDVKLVFVLGSDSFTIEKNGKSSSVTLDSVPYIKNGRVFVPIRFVAESLGYDVFWSENYRTGVYFDREAIVNELNEHFGIANSVLAMGSDLDLSKNYKGSVNMDMKITAIDSIAGNKTFTMGIDAVVIENQTSAKMTMEFDIASIIELLKTMASEQGQDMKELDVKMVFDVLKALNDNSIDMIIDLDKGIYYMKGSLFAVIGEYGELDVDKNTWVKLDISELIGMDFSELMAGARDMAGKMTVGDLLYIIYAESDNYDPVYAYENMFNSMNGLDIIADSAFRKSGSNYKYSLDLDGYIGYGESAGINATITMKDDKASRVKGGIEYSGDDMTVDVELDMTALEVAVTGRIHVKNTVKAEFSITSSVSETAENIPTAPPTGAKIISYEELTNIA